MRSSHGKASLTDPFQCGATEFTYVVTSRSSTIFFLSSAIPVGRSTGSPLPSTEVPAAIKALFHVPPPQHQISRKSFWALIGQVSRVPTEITSLQGVNITSFCFKSLPTGSFTVQVSPSIAHPWEMREVFVEERTEGQMQQRQHQTDTFR